MPDMPELDLSEFEESEATQRIRAAFEREQGRAQQTQNELAELKAQVRTGTVKDVLTKLGAPAQLAELYPADADTSEDAVKSFLTEKVGIAPPAEANPDDVAQNWSRYETVSAKGEPVAPAPDPDVELAERLVRENTKMYQNDYRPTDEDQAKLKELLHDTYQKLNKWDQDVASGKMNPLIDPQGFGGFVDPPIYARRARHVVTQGN